MIDVCGLDCNSSFFLPPPSLYKAAELDIVLQPQPENPPEGTTFSLSLTYADLQVRQGDCVYVLRDHDTPESERGESHLGH